MSKPITEAAIESMITQRLAEERRNWANKFIALIDLHGGLHSVQVMDLKAIMKEMRFKD